MAASRGKNKTRGGKGRKDDSPRQKSVEYIPETPSVNENTVETETGHLTKWQETSSKEISETDGAQFPQFVSSLSSEGLRKMTRSKDSFETSDETAGDSVKVGEESPGGEVGREFDMTPHEQNNSQIGKDENEIMIQGVRISGEMPSSCQAPLSSTLLENDSEKMSEHDARDWGIPEVVASSSEQNSATYTPAEVTGDGADLLDIVENKERKTVDELNHSHENPMNDNNDMENNNEDKKLEIEKYTLHEDEDVLETVPYPEPNSEIQTMPDTETRGNDSAASAVNTSVDESFSNVDINRDTSEHPNEKENVSIRTGDNTDVQQQNGEITDGPMEWQINDFSTFNNNDNNNHLHNNETVSNFDAFSTDARNEAAATPDPNFVHQENAKVNLEAPPHDSQIGSTDTIIKLTNPSVELIASVAPSHESGSVLSHNTFGSPQAISSPIKSSRESLSTSTLGGMAGNAAGFGKSLFGGLQKGFGQVATTSFIKSATSTVNRLTEALQIDDDEEIMEDEHPLDLVDVQKYLLKPEPEGHMTASQFSDSRHLQTDDPKGDVFSKGFGLPSDSTDETCKHLQSQLVMKLTLIERLRDQLDAAEQESSKFRNAESQSAMMIKQLQDRLKAKDEESHGLSKRAADARNAGRREIQEELQNQLNEMVSQKDSVIQQLRNEGKQKAQEVDLLQTQITQMNDDITKLAMTNKRASQEAHEISARANVKVKSLEDAADALRKELTELKEVHTALLRDTQNQSQATSSSQSYLQNQLSELSSLLQLTREQKTDAESENSQLKAKLMDLEIIRKLLVDAKVIPSQSNDKQSSISSSDFRRHVKALKAVYDEMQVELTSAQNEIIIQKSKVNDLSRELREMNSSANNNSVKLPADQGSSSSPIVSSSAEMASPDHRAFAEGVASQQIATQAATRVSSLQLRLASQQERQEVLICENDVLKGRVQELQRTILKMQNDIGDPTANGNSSNNNISENKQDSDFDDPEKGDMVDNPFGDKNNSFVFALNNFEGKVKKSRNLLNRIVISLLLRTLGPQRTRFLRNMTHALRMAIQKTDMYIAAEKKVSQYYRQWKFVTFQIVRNPTLRTFLFVLVVVQFVLLVSSWPRQPTAISEPLTTQPAAEPVTVPI